MRTREGRLEGDHRRGAYSVDVDAQRHAGGTSRASYLRELCRVLADGIRANARWAGSAAVALISTIVAEVAAPTAGTRAALASGGFLVFLLFWTHAGVRINAYRQADPAEEAELRTSALVHYSRASVGDLIDEVGRVHLDAGKCRQRSKMWLADGLRLSRRSAVFVLREGSSAAAVWGNLGPRPPATVIGIFGEDLDAGPLYIRRRDGAIGLTTGYSGRLKK